MNTDVNVENRFAQIERQTVQNVDDQLGHVHFRCDYLSDSDLGRNEDELGCCVRLEGGDRVDVIEHRNEVRIDVEAPIDVLLHLLKVLVKEVVTELHSVIAGHIDHVR